MKRKMRKPALAMIAIALLLSFGLVATAATLNVPGDFGTITEALAAASEGDTISVGADYDGTGEVFPILVQKDNITIDGHGTATVTGEDSNAVFVVGAFRELNETTGEYEYTTVSGVTIQGFTIVGNADIGIVVKYADNATVTGNTIAPTIFVGDDDNVILEGIRLVAASNSTISNNVITRMGVFDDPNYTGIGINVERSAYNTLTGNTVTFCGLGLFMFESSRNSVVGDTYTNNAFGGVVLNDTAENGLEGLTVTDNGGWGVRFVYANDDHLRESVVIYNLAGGVELIGSTACTVDSNIVASNGDPDYQPAPAAAKDGDPRVTDQVQIVVAPGDKALFESPVISTLNTLVNEETEKFITKPMNDFILEKHQIEEKLDLLEWWLHDLNDELDNIHQRLVIGNTEQAERELRAILRDLVAPSSFITRGDITSTVQTPSLVDMSWHGMDDPTHNFTLWDYDEYGDYDPNDLDQHPFDQSSDLLSVAKLDFYSGLQTESFTLVRSTDSGTPYFNRLTPELDQLTWDKIGIIRILIDTISNELANTFENVAWDHNRGVISTTDRVELLDSLQEKLLDWYELELITEDTYNDLSDKLNAVINLTDRLNDAVDGSGLYGGITIVGVAVDTNIVSELEAICVNLTDVNEVKLHMNIIDLIKDEMFDAILDMRHKLALVDLELPPLPHINSDLVGKKEKPWIVIDETTEIDRIIEEIEIAGGCCNAIPAPILSTFDYIYNTVLEQPDATADQKGLTHSTNNVISSNTITSDLMLAEGLNVGIVLASPHNVVVNNLMTNEGLPELDEYLRHITVGENPIYARVYRLDVGLWLLANECLIGYNAFEFVDWGIKRGGSWDFDDYQLEYVFTKMAQVAYWPGPGQVLELDRYSEVLNPGDKYYPPTVDVDYLPVLKLKKGTTNIAVAINSTVVGNRLSLNFFDHTGTGIEIIQAHSNMIDENLFYYVTSGNIIYRENAGAGIVVQHNDHFGGVAIQNETSSNLVVDASLDYTPPLGITGHATVTGLVNPPAAPTPWAYDNFLTDAKFNELTGWVLAKMGLVFDMKVFQWDGLPPNLAFFQPMVTLPTEKPRHPDDIFDALPQPACLSETFPTGWNLVSVPVIPVDSDPEAVFGDDVPFLYMFEWDGTEYVEPTEILPEHGYWIYLMSEATLDVCGVVLTEDVEFILGDAGWQMISTPTICVYWQSTEFKLGEETNNLAGAVAAGWLRPFFYPYDVAGGSYEPLGDSATDLVCPWPGYWIKTLVDGLTMVLPIEYMLDNPPVPPLSLRLQSIGVVGDTPPPPPPLPGAANPDDLVIVNTPNPIRDVHTTIFKVMGGFVDAVRVRIYDLSGQLVFEDENPGNELAWHTENLAGEYLANGAYLYRVEVKIGDQWVITKVQKLVIYR